jgi:hypothetical protein
MSVDYWLDLMRNHPANLVGAVLRPLWDSLFVAFQALSIAGIVATVIVNRASLARLWFFLVFLSLPYVSIVFFSPGATARGYLAYSSAFILFASRADGKGRRNSCRGGLRHRSDGRFPSASGIFFRQWRFTLTHRLEAGARRRPMWSTWLGPRPFGDFSAGRPASWKRAAFRSARL